MIDSQGNDHFWGLLELEQNLGAHWFIGEVLFLALSNPNYLRQ